MTALLLSQGISWLLLAALAGVVALLFRALRGFYRVVAPAGALVTSGGPVPGDVLPASTAASLGGAGVVIGGARSRPQLLLFIADDCPISQKMAPIARQFTQHEGFDLVYMGDDTSAAQDRMVERLQLDRNAFVNDEAYGRLLAVDKLPFAVLVDEQGALMAKGLVNSREHLESLTAVRETGHASVQSWLAARQVAA